MRLRHNIILKYAFFLALAACAGAGPGAGGGPMDGSVGGGGNYAAGPVSLPAPATLNKNLIVCENIAGPDVVCRGSAGATTPYAQVQVSVHSAGYSAWRQKLESLLVGTAYAAGASVTVNADGMGAFTAQVEAAKGEVIEIRVGSSRLLLTVPEELESVGGSSGTMKNMTVDSEGSIWFSRRPVSPSTEKRRFSWTSLFFSEARAQSLSFSRPLSNMERRQNAIGPHPHNVFAHHPQELVSGVVSEAARCDSHPFQLQAALASEVSMESRCELKRIPPGMEQAEVFASFPNCTQEDIRFIQPATFGTFGKYVLVGIKNSVYLVSVDQEPGTIAKRFVYPGPVHQAGRYGGQSITTFFVFLEEGALPQGAPHVYLLSWPPMLDGIGGDAILSECTTTFAGVSNAVLTDQRGWASVLVGKGSEDSRVLLGPTRQSLIKNLDFFEVFRSPHPLEAAILEVFDSRTFHTNEGANQNYYRRYYRVTLALLSPAAIRLSRVECRVSEVWPLSPCVVETRDLSFDLSAYKDPWNLRIDHENSQLAFLDRGGSGARVVILPFQADETRMNVDLAAAEVRDLGAVVPTALEKVARDGADGEWVVSTGEGNLLRVNRVIERRDSTP